MANRRILKKNINLVCGDLFAECIATTLYGEAQSNVDAHALLSSILIMHNDFISRVSHQEPGMQPKKFYKALLTDFNRQVSEIVDHINNAD